MNGGGNSSQENPGGDVSPADVAGPDAEQMVETREQFIERALADYESPLVGYAMGFVHDLDRARDIVQDTFIRLCRQDVEKVRGGLKTWLFTVCRNRALDILRKESRMLPLDDERHQRMAGESATPDEALVQGERLDRVMRCLDRLSENQKQVILMKFHQGMSYQEISRATGLSGGNVGFLIHSGLKRLRQILPADLKDGPPT